MNKHLIVGRTLVSQTCYYGAITGQHSCPFFDGTGNTNDHDTAQLIINTAHLFKALLLMAHTDPH